MNFELTSFLDGGIDNAVQVQFLAVTCILLKNGKTHHRLCHCSRLILFRDKAPDVRSIVKSVLLFERERMG